VQAVAGSECSVNCVGLTIAVSALTFVHALQLQRLPWVASTSTVNLTAPQ
jgi:hypothetical protein